MNIPQDANCTAPLELNSTMPLALSPNLKDFSKAILDSNYVPHDSEIAYLRDRASAGRARRARLDAEIAALTLERKEVDNWVREYEGAASLLRGMPAELLSLIFTDCTRHHWKTVWTLSYVCRRWREVLITQPLFWVEFAVDLRQGLPTRTSEFRLRTQVQRSGRLPLDITFCTYEEEYGHHEKTISQILCEHCTRWETVTIEGPKELFLDLGGIRGRLPLLKNLKIEVLVTSNNIVPPLDMFEIAPNLQQVSVNKDCCGIRCEVRLPFSQLCGYVGTNSWNGHLETLRTASNLVELSLSGEDLLAAPQSGIISLPHLLRLFITETTFLGCLETPQLGELYCSGPQDRHFCHFLERTSSVHTLVMWHTISASNLVLVLDAVKTLAVIGISVSPWDAGDILALLTMGPEGTDTVPALEHISIALPNSSLAMFSLFLDMVESRWRRTRVIRVAYEPFCPAESYERVELLRAQGLEISATPLLCLIPHNLVI
ncbi:hypothetical protein C8J57DRAFT_1468740 [Mycena rebaudengoi]|nr:hypothetical protein C8J57DRAFT_1468740 [Mycena rebaudengoi]